MPPRFVRIQAPGHTRVQRINLGHIVRWVPDGETTTVYMDDSTAVTFTDPDGKIDDLICKAFFEVTPQDLGVGL